MKKYIFMVALITLPAFSHAAYDHDKGWYLSLGTGYSVNSSKNATLDGDPDFSVASSNVHNENELLYSFGVGKRITDNVRLSFNITRVPSHNFTSKEVHIDRSDGQKSDTFFSADIINSVAMMNFYYDMNCLHSKFIPFVNVGVGMARNRLENTSYYEGGVKALDAMSKSKNYFAWSAGIGLGMKIRKDLYIDLAYSYMDLGKAQASSIGTIVQNNNNLSISQDSIIKLKKLKSNQVTVGIRFEL